MEEVEPELDLPELSIEAQLEVLRARGAPDLRQDDAVVHDVDMNAAPDQDQECVLHVYSNDTTKAHISYLLSLRY